MNISNPKTLVLGENPGSWLHDDPNPPFSNTNGVEAWVFAMQGRYQGPGVDSLGDAEIVIGNLKRSMFSTYLELISKRKSGVKWISLIEGCGEDYLDYMPHLKQILDQSDLVIAINEHTLPFFRKLTDTPVELLGVPYPVDFMRGRRKPLSERRNEVLICPKVKRLPSVLVAQKAEMPMRMYGPKLHRKLKTMKHFIKHGSSAAKEFYLDQIRQGAGPLATEVHFERSMHDFFEDVSFCRYWINLDPRYTWARYVLDGAALGTPVISTMNTVHTSKLFPELTVPTVFDTEKAIEMAIRLREDRYWQQVVEAADSCLDDYSYASCRAKLLRALEIK